VGLRGNEIPLFCLPDAHITFATNSVEWMHIGYDFVHVGYLSNNCVVTHGDLALNTMFIVTSTPILSFADVTIVKTCETWQSETSLPDNSNLSTSLHTCLLAIFRMIRHTSTNVPDSRSRGLLKKLVVAQLVRKFPALYRTQQFIDLLTRDR
jgi:hypothetical protein